MGIRTDRLFGFASASEYGKALLHAPRTVVQRAFLTKSVEEQQEDAEEGGAHMKRCLVSFSRIQHQEPTLVQNRQYCSVAYAAAAGAAESRGP
jgi:hypothetical protein